MVEQGLHVIAEGGAQARTVLAETLHAVARRPMGLFYHHRMLPMIAYSTPDPYAFSVCKHILHWKGLFDSPLVRPPYAKARAARRGLNAWLAFAPTVPPAVC